MNLSLLGSSSQMFHTSRKNHHMKIPLLLGWMKSVSAVKYQMGKGGNCLIPKMWGKTLSISVFLVSVT